MKTFCPYCGSVAIELSQKRHTPDRSDIAFRCEDVKCSKTFTRTLDLTPRVGRQGVEHFAMIEPVEQLSVKTDC